MLAKVLVVVNPFGHHKVGSVISNPYEMNKVLEGENFNHVVAAMHDIEDVVVEEEGE